MGLDMLHSIHIAREESAALFFVKPRFVVNDAMYALESAEVRMLRHTWALDFAMMAIWRIGWVVQTLKNPCGFWKRSRLRRWFFSMIPQSLRNVGKRMLRREAKQLSSSGDVQPGRTDEGTAKGKPPPLTPIRSQMFWGQNFRRSFVHRLVPVHLPEYLEEEAASEAVKLGITDAKKIVTLHAREPGFHAQLDYIHGPKNDTRNAHIETFFDAIDYLVGEGYTVVRVGDASMTPVVRTGVIDLANASVSSRLVELWAIMHSEFFICCNSGPYCIAQVTNTPALMVNDNDPAGNYPTRRFDLYMPKRIVDRESGRIMSIAETLEQAVYLDGRRALSSYNESQPYEFIDNTSSEILDGVHEMRALLAGDSLESPSQARYKQLMLDLFNGLRNSPKLGDFWEAKLGREPMFLGTGRIVRSFAERYLDASESLTSETVVAPPEGD